jgi:predicted GH43/DUF377 family glycosyl hydrolase
MKWRKRGLVYDPAGEFWWARSYAAIPTAEVNGDSIRVYFTGLDEPRFGRIGYVDVDAGDPGRIIGRSQEPVLDLGLPGTFDDSGVNASSLIEVDGKKFLYYIGWQRAERVPYLLFGGLAVSENGGPFQRASAVPILERNDREPFLRSAPCVLRDGDRFRVWYVSGLGWTDVGGISYPTYVIRHADSSDGIQWSSEERICINFESPDEFGFGRPWVVKEDSVYRMWYSIRSRSAPYRIGYAESPDGTNWTRRDELTGIERSESGWDSEMICYPCVVDAAGRRYMFYNGNRHGSTGFGFAELEA